MAGVSMRQVCQKAKVHPTTVSRWKKSERNPDPLSPKLKTISKLNDALDKLVAAERKSRRKVVAA